MFQLSLLVVVKPVEPARGQECKEGGHKIEYEAAQEEGVDGADRGGFFLACVRAAHDLRLDGGQ